MLDSKTPKAAPPHERKTLGPQTETCSVDKHIGSRAAERRLALGLALGDVAPALEVDGALLDQLEGGHQRFAARQLWKLSHRLQVPMAWFFKVQAEAAQPRASSAKTDHAATTLIFVPNPDLDRSGDGEPVPVH